MGKNKKWFTVTKAGKYETIIKDSNSWEKLGYNIQEKEKEVLLVK